MIEKLKDICLHLNLISSHDLKCYSELELLYFMIKKINEVIETTNKIVAKEEELIINQLKEWKENGTLAALINEVAFSQLSSKIDSLGLNAKYPISGLTPCIGDGTTDDTQALQDMINYLSVNGGGMIYLPQGDYLVGDIVLKSGVGLKGAGTLSTYVGSEHPTRLVAKTGATTIINGEECNTSHIDGIMFDGVNKATCGLIRGSFITIENCHFRKCKYALGNGIALQTFIIQNNKFDSNVAAIWSTVDSRIINNTINANDMGIKLGTGANDNIIAENKIEWNNTIGIEMYQCHNNTISNNVVDRQGQQGIDIKACGNCTISSNVFRRNGASTSDNLNIKTHIRSEGNERIVIIGNVTIASKTQDDGSGLDEPPYSIIDYSNVDMLIVGNQLKGCTFKSIETYNSTNTIELANIKTTED